MFSCLPLFVLVMSFTLKDLDLHSVSDMKIITKSSFVQLLDIDTYDYT